jgi:kelch-like protein 19
MKNCDVLKKLPACREYLAQIFKVVWLYFFLCSCWH